VENHLAPALSEGDVVVMDNLSGHKGAGVPAAIEEVGADLWYLPPYSPDLNPIEKLWSKIKTGLRCIAARTFEGVPAAMRATFHEVTTGERRNDVAASEYGK
ncbi:MAG: transposase, partial [Planctomycetota bacterium]